MFARFLLICPFLFAAVRAQAEVDKDPGKKGDLYPIYEHGEGRWLSFDAPLQVRHHLETPALRGYKLTLTVSVLIRDGKQSEVHFTFTEEGTSKPGIPPELPASTHVEIVIGEKNGVALPLTASSFTELAGERQIATRFATVPLPTFRQMVGAKSLRGQLYWRSKDGKILGQNDLRFFTLDEKALRTLAALDAKAR